MNFYKRHIGDYIKKAGHLTLLEHGVYARLMDVYYTREAGIPEDKAARLIGARTKEEQQALANVLDEFFTLVDGLWTQGRCEEEIGNASEKAEKNRANGAKGGRPRKSLTDQQPAGNPDGFGIGNHVGSENNLSQTPDSRLQTKDLGDRASDQPESGAVAPTPVGLLSKAMRDLGIMAQPADPRLIALAEQGVTVATVQAACQDAKDAKKGERIAPAYVFAILERWSKEAAALNATGAAAPRQATRQSSTDQAVQWAASLTGRNRHEHADQPDIIDINPAPGLG